MSITIHCDMCGKKQEQDKSAFSNAPVPNRLFSTLLSFIDFRKTGTNRGVEKKEHHLCPECTEDLLGKMKNE